MIWNLEDWQFPCYNVNNNSNKSNGSDKTKYYKRDKSLDIIRNNNDEYDVVLPYQRYVKKTK